MARMANSQDLVKDDSETAVANSTARHEGFSSALEDVVAFSSDHNADVSGNADQHFDDMVARTHAARVAEIEAS